MGRNQWFGCYTMSRLGVKSLIRETKTKYCQRSLWVQWSVNSFWFLLVVESCCDEHFDLFIPTNQLQEWLEISEHMEDAHLSEIYQGAICMTEKIK